MKLPAVAQRSAASACCAVCAERLRFALALAATYRLPVGRRTVDPHEAATWARLQRASVGEVAAALAAAERCDG